VTDSRHHDSDQPAGNGGTVEAVAIEAPPAAGGSDDVESRRASRDESASSAGKSRSPRPGAAEGLPIKMLHDRILVQMEGPDGDRKSSGGILIPATAQVGKRLTWAQIVAAGPSVRSMELGDRVLFNPEDRYEVEVGGLDYIILRERDVHAVAAERLDDSHTGLYL
jgi:chaperonin GroES